MDYYKIQIKILKAALKKLTEYRLGQVNDKIAVVEKGVRILLIPNNQFFLNYRKLLNGQSELMNIKSMIRDEEALHGELTGDIKALNKKSYLKIANDKEYAWINKDLLAEFEKDCTFKISGPKKPVFIYEKEELAGLVLPFNFGIK